MPKNESTLPEYPEVNHIALILFCCYVVCWYLQIGYRVPFLGKIRFELVYAIILLFVMLFTVGLPKLENPLMKYLILLFLCFVVEIPFSYDPILSWNVFVDKVIKFAFMAIFIVAFVKNPKSLVFFIGAFMLACFKMGQEGLWGQITGGLVWQNQGIMKLHGATPMYRHPNSFAGMALGTLPFIYYLFPLVHVFMKIILIVMLAFSINIVLFTGSRTGYVAFIVFIIYIIIISKNKFKIITCIIIFGIICIPIIPNDYVERFHSIFTGKEKEGGSREARIVILKDAIKIFIAHPFGVGIGAFPAIRKELFGRTQDTHNLYLEVATNLGIQGFVVFMLYIYNMMKVLNHIRKKALKQMQLIEESLHQSNNNHFNINNINPHLQNLKYIYAISSSVSVFIIIRLALGLFGMDLYEIYWWFALGLTIALFNINEYAIKRTEAILSIMQ
jgi:hypothetical protein